MKIARCCVHAAATVLLLACGLSIGLGAAAASSPARQSDWGQVYLLAVGICPPYRTDIPVSVCSNGVKAVADSFGEALDIDTANIVTLHDEQATARNFLRVLADLGERLTSRDRLILYLNGHGDSFSQWARYYGQGGVIAEINDRYTDPNADLVVFWTKEQPTVPALALANEDWLTVADIVDAIVELPGRVALILESCSSGRVFDSFHRHARQAERIDYIVASSGSEQLSNINSGQTMPLFTEQLTGALDMPMVRDFGAAVELARIMTVQMAVAICATQTVPKDMFTGMYPGLTVPSAVDQEGSVLMPLWACGQVPSVADLTGNMTNWPLYAGRSATGSVPLH